MLRIYECVRSREHRPPFDVQWYLATLRRPKVSLGGHVAGLRECCRVSRSWPEGSLGSHQNRPWRQSYRLRWSSSSHTSLCRKCSRYREFVEFCREPKCTIFWNEKHNCFPGSTRIRIYIYRSGCFTSNFLNLSGRSWTRWGMCKSPMTSTSFYRFGVLSLYIVAYDSTLFLPPYFYRVELREKMLDANARHTESVLHTARQVRRLIEWVMVVMRYISQRLCLEISNKWSSCCHTSTVYVYEKVTERLISNNASYRLNFFVHSKSTAYWWCAYFAITMSGRSLMHS